MIPIFSQLTGRVISGRGLGKGLGAPTLNFDSMPEGLDYGVYLGATVIEQKKYPSVAHWGPRPTFGLDEPVLEVHILDFSEDLYGKTVVFQFLKKIREVRFFATPQELQDQIAQDILEARVFFEAHRP